ncbi:hypothetical protein [Streptomyces marianii]|uniref:Uncharacterized protein n=1 Tax=Streptomyces marianii TaxID=1817406 RepID=A0A5R9DU40_9ACTN|nr:hypothetical protein [Streptomyces marianii]TLQ39291.1 hypothetical protein FEF34_38515 [Streptomyces marianii]
MPDSPPPSADTSGPDRQVTWSVSVYRRSGPEELHEYTTHRLASLASAREHMSLARERPWVSRIALTAHIREVTRRAITGQELLAPGRRLPAPEPRPEGRVAARFYEIEGGGPGGMLSADEARWHLDLLHHLAHAAGHAARGEHMGATLWEVTIVDIARPIDEEDLPQPS